MKRARALPGAIALGAVFACTVIPYAVSVDRGVDFGDYGDFQVVPYILGIAYPSGFPAYTLLGWVWSHGFVVGNVALRMNLLSVLAAALTNAFLAGLLVELGIPVVAAAVAALTYGFAYQVWTHAGAANAHEVGTALLVGALFGAARWVRSGSPAALATSCLTYAAAIACDNSTVLALPGIALMLGCRRIPARRVAALATLAAAIVALTYAYLPLRSAYVSSRGLDPVRAIGLQDGDHQFWDQGHPSTLRNFVAVTTGEGFHAQSTFWRMLAPRELLRTWNDLSGQATTAFGPLALVVAIVAVVIFLRDKRRLGAGVALVSLLTALFITAWHGESDVTRYAPRELVLVVAALAWLYARLARGRQPGATFARAGFVLLVVWAAGVDVGHAGMVAHDRAARDAQGLVALAHAIPHGAVIVAPWKDAAPLAYETYVEGMLIGGIVVCCDLELVRPQVAEWSLAHRVVAIDDDGVAPATPGLDLTRVATNAGVALYRVKATVSRAR